MDNNFKILKLKKVHNDKFMLSKKGLFLEDEFITEKVDYDCDCYDNKGKLLFKFRKKVITNTKNGWDNFKDVSIETTDMRGASTGPIDINSLYFKDKIKDESLINKNGFSYMAKNMKRCSPIYSSAIGNYDVMSRFGTKQPCRQTGITKKYFDNLVCGIDYLEELSDWYKKLNREKWDDQYKQSTLKGEWNIGNTPFSTITINRNFRTGVHKDGGDYGGWAVLSVLQEGQYDGGLFMLPQYGVGIDIREGDVLVADVHQYHTNSEFRTTEEQDIYNETNCELYKNEKQHKWVDGSKYKFTRISFVCYLRAKMNECDTIPDKPIKKKIKNLELVLKEDEENITDYKIAIPSYKRFNELEYKTLSFLNGHKINQQKIYIFVREDDLDLSKYLALRSEGYNVVIAGGVKGIGMTHNFITEYFNEEEFIVELDDDILDIIDKNKSSILNFNNIINEMKTKMEENNISYGGIYQVDNKLFMSNSDNYTYDLRYCLGLVRFRFIRKDIILETNYSEDFENSIVYYIRDGKILKNNWLCGTTKNYANGGCNADGRNFDTEKRDKEHLANKYPQYCRLFQRKNERWDLRLKHYKSKPKIKNLKK
tara:strand:- start:3444 stop:5231 length:1788 start_codon:yes stop_codon:yes gene_type:complete